MLGALLEVLLIRSNDAASRSGHGNPAAQVWVFGVVVAVMLFVHGYYITTAIFGVLWRSKRPWSYPAILAALFALHTHITFLHGKPDFTREARAMEFPLVVGGVVIVLMCSSAGNEILRHWTGDGRRSNPYLSASVLTLFGFLLLNIANYLRPIDGNFSFRPYGLPFTFYREGGYVQEWVWRSGVVVWKGLIADLVVVGAIAAPTGKAAQRLRVIR
ncbi:hypothetical protein SAMN05443244_2434 [Terriglobus roseus]|uniref:Uncharacterized protein n=2 Tax=Terriglobus roseus TaxID=392734 RepID=A0A1H4P2I2_9BACT|nr:hypothetical protein SAMN05443244_2434 [Terriglobus roseus]